MKYLSKKIADLITFDLLNKTKEDLYNIYKRQKELRNKALKYMLVTISIFITLCLYNIIFIAYIKSDMKTFELLSIIGLFIILSIGISSIYVSWAPFRYNKKTFSLDEKIKSLKKNILLIMDNEKYSLELKQESKDLLKIINNKKEIEKIIKNTGSLSPSIFYDYFETEHENPNKKISERLLQNKSVAIEHNLELIRKELSEK